MASLRRVPKLRDQVITVKQIERGEVIHVCKVVETGNYYRFDELQYRLINLLDGKRTLEDMVADFNAESEKIAVDLEFIEQFVDNVRGLDIVEQTREEKKALLLERIRDERRRRSAGRSVFGNILDIKLSAWNPDRYFEQIHPCLRFLYTPAAIIVSVTCMLAMFGLWMSEWERMKEGTLDLFNFANKSGADILQFLIILFVVSFVHETAHGLTCKHFGGVVPNMGFMIIYFTPCFFVDISDGFMFDRHYKRQWTIFAGGYVELLMCSFATFVWVLTSPGTLVNDVAYKTLLMTGLLSVIVNYNPLLKLDGYYALMDYLEIADLWERSFEYTGNWIKRTIFRLPAEPGDRPPTERRILLAYCLASVAYKAAIIVFFLLFLRNILLGLLGNGGYLVLAVAVYFALKGPLISLGQFLKFAVLDKKEVLMTRRTLLYAGSASALTLALLTLVPVPVFVRGECTVEPASTAVVRPSIEGRIDDVFVNEGQRVEAGDSLAVLTNDMLMLAIPELEDRLAFCEQEIAGADHLGDRAVLARKLWEREFLLQERRALEEKTDALTLRAPMAGVVTTPRLDERRGSHLNAGQSFCEIASLDPPIARVPIREYRTDEIVPGQIVELSFASHPFTSRSGRVAALSPAPRLSPDASPARPGADLEPGPVFVDFEAIVALDGDLDGLRYGTRGSARIRVGEATLAGRVGRELRRWFASHIWW